MMKDFNSFGLPTSLKNRLDEVGFTEPTEIQQKVIPFGLNGVDILASSKTGSGKTGAFSIPVITKAINDNTHTLILVPTRELAIQVKDAIVNFIGKEQILTAVVFGGSDIKRQIEILRKKPKIVIATPGRLNDHIDRRTIRLDGFGMLVLDEFDRMLEMGFKNEIKAIISQLPKERQTLMFSATTRKSIKDAAKEYLKDPYEEIILESAGDDHQNITQEFVNLSRSQKYDTLLETLKNQHNPTIIFVATKSMADQLAHNLKDDEYLAAPIHGDLRQREREATIRQFRGGKYQILVATDVVARGLDIPDVDMVINYDMPNNPEDYTHRIGRTGRAGKNGFSLSFVTPSDAKIHRAITMKQNSDEFDGNRPRGGGFGGGRGRSGGGSKSFGGGIRGGFGGNSNGSGNKRSYGSENNRDRPPRKSKRY